MSNHILIIEDDAAIAEVLRLNLECADYTVTAFDNALPCCRSFRNTESPSSA